MTITPVSPSPITASVRRRYLTGTGHPPPTAPSVPPSAGKTRSLEYQITVPIASRATKTSFPLFTQPASLFETDKSDLTIKSSTAAKSP